MENEITKKEENFLQEQDKNISDIVSNDDIKNLLDNIIKEFDNQRNEAMDAYYIFKDMITNSGDFDSSQSTKEQLTALLKNAQEASNAKMKILDTLIRSKIKQQPYIEHAEIKQNNYFMNNRRDLLKELEKMKEEDENIIDVIANTDENDDIEKEIISNENKNKEIKSKNINNKDEINFEIGSGDFE